MKRHLIAGLLLCLASGPLLAVEDPEQLKSLKQAAESGNVTAQYDLGVLYEFGYRMKTHRIPALAWYMVAADNGDARAIKRRDYLMSQLTPDQVEEAKKLRAGFGVKKPEAAAKPEAAPAQPAGEAPKPEPAQPTNKPETAPAKPEAAKPAAEPAKPEPKPESKPSGDGPAVQPLLPPPSN